MARLFVLGAGFSRYAGLPLGKELFTEVLTEARRTDLYVNILEPDLYRFRAFKERTEGIPLTEENVDAEEFMSFLDVEHFLRFAGGDVYSEEGDRSQQLVKNLIAKILQTRQSHMTEEQWKAYIDFASRLEPYDVVITFNYDTVLELALERARCPYRLVPSRFDEVKPSHGVVKSPETEVVVLKMHGSIDWFDITPWEHNQEYFAQFDFAIPDRHPIFSHPEIYEPTPIVHEPYFADSHMRRIRRIKNLERYFLKANLVIEAPLILPPSYQKLLYSDPLKELWWGMDSAGSLNQTVAIIGFSLPPHDQYALQAIYTMVYNFQHVETGDLIKKTRLRLVDWCPTDEVRGLLKQRYRFIDWGHADLDGRGFRPETIQFLFADGNTAR